jgi:hypothetical protein
MSKKTPSLYLPNSDKVALVITGECLPAGKAVANPDNIVRFALIEGKNHKIASVVRLHDHPLEFIKHQIIGKKAILSRRLCQILILPSAGKNSLPSYIRILKKIQSCLLTTEKVVDMPHPRFDKRTINGVKTNSLQLHHI